MTNFSAISDWISRLVDSIFYPKSEKIENVDYTLEELCLCLTKHVQELESRVKVLEEENVNLSNSMYEIANSLEARIDIISQESYKLPSNAKELR